MKETILKNYTYPANAPTDDCFKVMINNQEVFVYKTTTAYFACVSFDGELSVVVETKRTLQVVHIRPLSYNIPFEHDEYSVRFKITEPSNLFIECNDQNMPLFLFANPLETNVPSMDDPNVVYFKAGAFYDVGVLTPKANQTIYIEGGAVVRGIIRAAASDHITISGRGIIESKNDSDIPRRFFVVFEHCQHLYIEGIILIEPSLWMLVFGACHHVHVNNIKEIGYCVSSDGIDVVGSKHVLIENSFIYNNDDSIVIKSLDNSVSEPHNATLSWEGDVEDIRAQNCVIYNNESNAGNALEIGFELRTHHVQNVIFENIDIIAVHGFGAAFSIHNGDRAIISDITYQNIRVEHCFDRIVDFRLENSPQWNKDKTLGSIRNITFKDIYIHLQKFNQGYTHSLLGAKTDDNPIENVFFINFRIGDKVILNNEDMWLFTNKVKNITYKTKESN